MYVDPITRADLHLFHPEENYSVFHRLDFTSTDGGRNQLRYLFEHPLRDRKNIEARQRLIKRIGEHVHQWPTQVTNGTLHAVEKWLDYPLDPIGPTPASLPNLLYRWLHPADHSMIRYSLPHLFSLYEGCSQIHHLLSGLEEKGPLQADLHRLDHLLHRSGLHRLQEGRRMGGTAYLASLQLARLTRTENRDEVWELVELYYRFDAWFSMAKATIEWNMSFPVFLEREHPLIRTVQLTHLQLKEPVGYDLQLGDPERLLFLTGANMAGKSTLIKSIGIAVYLAHLGMGVPAREMELTLFDGLLSNVNSTDNIVKGESYFFNEVQRIKKTLEHMIDGRRWLVLIDELFKGTNVEDARRCSLAVIQGVVRLPQALTLLSTHLYEIGASLTAESGILFRYFETEVRPDALHFSYQLKEGVSEDRIGYRILEREGVTAILDQIQRNIES